MSFGMSLKESFRHLFLREREPQEGDQTWILAKYSLGSSTCSLLVANGDGCPGSSDITRWFISILEAG